MKGIIPGCLACMLAATAAQADSIGDPAGTVGRGHYAVSVGTARTPREVASDEYISSGYYMKVQGGMRRNLDFYVRIGGERVTIPGTTTATELQGDSGFALGGGVKLALPEVPVFHATSFLDLGMRTFESGGTVTVLQPATPAPFMVDVESRYDWREYRAGYGIRKAGAVMSPFLGVTASWVDLQVTRRQLGGASTPTETGTAFEGPIYGGFLGLDVHISSTTSLVMELNQDATAGTGFSISLGEVTR